MTVDFLAGVLRGERSRWPFGMTEHEAARFLDVARRHGVHALVAQGAGDRSDWPKPVRAALSTAAVSEVTRTALVERELCAVLETLAAEGVRPLLIKGAALAYTHYPQPHLRPRFDTDLLLREDQLPAAAASFERMGYRRPNQATGRLVMHQVDYCKVDERGVRHVYDLHWKPVNPHALADALPLGDLEAASVPVPALGTHARAPEPVHAALLACIHRAAHHGDDERLLWVYDIHRLVTSMTPPELDRLCGEAERRNIAVICGSTLRCAATCLGTPVPDAVLARLERHRAGTRQEPSARYARGPMRRLDVLLSDLRALDRWGDRAALLREHAFPPAGYVMGAYHVSNRAVLPALYVHRLVSGAWRWLRRAV